MPKRVGGICPDCGEYVPKRGGKLRHHLPKGTKYDPGSFMNPSSEPHPGLCAGSGKRVPTWKVTA